MIEDDDQERTEKYPRTMHLPFSPNSVNPGHKLYTVDHLLNKPLIFTEKMDGSNVCLMREDLFARSHSGAPIHESFDALKALHATIKLHILEGEQIFGEWCFAKHSIAYQNLPSFLLLFGIRCQFTNKWRSFEQVETWAWNNGLPTVPLLERDIICTSADELKKIVELHASTPSIYGVDGVKEGVVIRIPSEFDNNDFKTSLAKWVRKDHVQTDEHWTNQVITKNKLAK